MAKQKEENKKEKPLTDIDVLCRVRGIGQAEAASVLASHKITENSLADAYARGADSVESLLAAAWDKANPAPEPEPEAEQDEEVEPTE